MSKLFLIVELPDPQKNPSRPHHHSQWEICCYTSGKGVAVVRGGRGRKDYKMEFQTGTIICFPPHLSHYHVSPKGCTEFCIFIDKFDAGGQVVPVFTDSANRAFERTSRMLHEEYRKREGDWEVATQQLLDRLMLLLGRWRGGETHPLVEQLKTMIFEHMSDSTFHAGDAAARLPMSIDHLRKLFRSATGRTPTQYLIDLRVAEAKRLLKAGLFTAKQVAQRVGIDNPYYFSRLFLQTTGQRPSVYAKTTQAKRQIDTYKD